MNESISVRDVMTRSYVGLSEGDSVAGAATLMRDEGMNFAVVLRGKNPVGVLDAEDIVVLVADDVDPKETTVVDAMHDVPVSVEADGPLSEAAAAIADSGRRRAIVSEGDEVLGVLSEADIVTAHSVMSTPTQEPVEPSVGSNPSSPMATDETDFDEQGVCEVCGSLVRSLRSANGQLVCPDCLEV